MPARCVAVAEGERCADSAVFYDREGKRRWCAAHAPEGSGKGRPRRECEVCPKTAIYGHPPTRCGDHVTSPCTNCEACGSAAATTVVHATSGGRTGAKLCDACAADAVEHCKGGRAWKPRCTHERCEKTRSFGFEYGKPLFCAAHRPPGTTNVRCKARCQVDGCSQPAEYGNETTRWCKTHAAQTAHAAVTCTQRCAYLVCEAAGCLHHATHALRGDAFAKQMRWCDRHAPASARLVWRF
jgi:hypothetical protein